MQQHCRLSCSHPVKVMPVSKTMIARTIDYTSTIQAYEEVNLAPSTPGRVDKIYVEVGDRVQKGQKLFLMDRTQYYANKIQLANLEKDLARLDTLLKVGSVKEQLYDQTKAQYEVMKTNVDFMEENTQLEAPFSGIITGKYLEDGELYSGAPGMSGKAAVVTLMQINPVKIIISISEQYFPLIKNGMKVRVWLMYTLTKASKEPSSGFILPLMPCRGHSVPRYASATAVSCFVPACSPGHSSTWDRKRPSWFRPTP
jgi:membrane fusion protein, multidrug efflux system